jgi:hypothetical protein
MFSRRPRIPLEDAEHTPLLAMWYQTRTALAELIIPLLAGLKTLWLLFFSPVRFFEVAFRRARPLESLRSPIDPFWRTLTPEERRPLDPAHFLLFGIFAAALANFQFDNSNRLSGLLSDGESGLFSTVTAALSNLLPALSGRLEDIQAFLQGTFFAQLRTFIDPSLTAVIAELITNLLLLLIFTYLFYLLIRRRIPAVYSYAFWLYAAGAQFVTTAVSHFFFAFISLPTFNLPQITPDIIFVIVETGLLILWQYLYPAFILPRVFPGSISGKEVLIAAILGRGILAIAGWLIFGGFVLIATFIGNL